MIRLARPDDLDLLAEVERAASRRFADVGIEEFVGSATPRALLSEAQREARLWVAADEADRPVGFVLAAELDGTAFVEELDVQPSAGGRGLGRRLIDQVALWARARGLAAVTLSTCRDVPFNAPWYQRMGFRVLGEREWTPGLRAVREAEAARGWLRYGRVLMRREV